LRICTLLKLIERTSLAVVEGILIAGIEIDYSSDPFRVSTPH
jgi:hypothetical protein